MYRSRVTFATTEAAAIAALFSSPSTIARCAEAVDEADVGRLTGPERLAQPAEVRLVQPVAVDHSGREDVHRYPLGAGEHGAIELLARIAVELLRVVQERERTRAIVTQALEVE